MGLMEMMKYDIGALSMGEKLLGSLIVMVLGMVTCLAVLAVLIGCIKLMSAAFGRKKAEDKPAEPEIAPAPVPVQTAAPAPVYEIEAEDDGELVAVITAAIAAASGSGSFTIKNITETKTRPVLSNWVTAGRFEAFDSRKVNKR